MCHCCFLTRFQSHTEGGVWGRSGDASQ
jgi:hypothetical protein